MRTTETIASSAPLNLEQARQAYKQGTKNVCEALDKFVAGQTDKAGIESAIAAMALAETNFLEAARKGGGS